jgi:hypothetical protein
MIDRFNRLIDNPALSRAIDATHLRVKLKQLPLIKGDGGLPCTPALGNLKLNQPSASTNRQLGGLPPRHAPVRAYDNKGPDHSSRPACRW